MRFISLDISNFKGIKNYSYLPVNKTAVLMGNNGVGKTSFIEAIRYAITGETPYNCIRDGASVAKVEATVNDGTVFSRMIFDAKPSKVVVNGKTTTGKSLDEYIFKKTGVSKEAFKITTSKEVLENLKPDQFGSFIMAYTKQKLDFETFCSYIPDLTPDGKTEISKILPEMPEKFGFDKIQILQEYLFEERKSLKRELEVRKSIIGSFNGKEPTRKIEDIEKELEKVIGIENSQLIAKSAINAYTAYIKQKEHIEKSIEDLKDKIDSNKSVKPDRAILNSANEKKEELRKSIIAAEKLKQTLSDTLVMLENTLKNLNKPVCPISEKLICTTDKTKAKQDFMELIESNKEGIEYQNGEIEKIQAAIDEIEKEIDNYRKNETLYNEKVTMFKQYDEMKKNIPAVIEKPVVTEIEDISEKKTALQKERDEYIAYVNHCNKMREHDIIASNLELIASLYTAVRPKGEVMCAISNYFISDFENLINERAKELRTDFSISFMFNDGINYFVKTSATSEPKAYESLSNGEKSMTAFLILDMLNTLCGTKILILDDMNHLDKKSFGEIFKLIQSKEFQDSYDHIFVCSVKNSDFEDVISSYKDFDTIF